jgi:ABC-2 type transport system ATP-binding protein
VILRVAGDPDGLAGILGALPGVLQAVEQVDGSFELESSPGTDVRPEVARAVINGGFDLLEMRQVGLSLEDIFMQLTREEPAPPEMSEAGLDVLDEIGDEEEARSD